MRPSIVGLDLSLTKTGVSVDLGDGSDIILDTIETGTGVPKNVTPTWKQRNLRLSKISDRIHSFTPSGSLVLMEGPSYASSGSGTFDRAGLWWRVYRDLLLTDCRILVVSPAQRMMYATGKGVASKDAVLAAVVKKYLDLEVSGNDIADALVLLAIGRRLVGEPIEDSLPQTHLRALDKIRPEYDELFS